MSKKSKKQKKARKNQNKTANKDTKEFELVKPNAAGIDVGSGEHWVCVPQGRDEKCIRKFGAYTSDLYAIANWLKECGVTTVAMESTGVYWIALFQILEKQGFEVCLVNARHVKNVPGRTKTDKSDCKWIQKLHSCGLLQASFRPDDKTCKLRSLLRHRDTMIKLKSTHTLHMQKSLQQMNIRIDKAVSDITGVTGMRIIKAILQGERNLKKLASLKDPRAKASEEEIARALEGDYREEHLFTLKQSMEFYGFTKAQIAACDREIEELLKSIDKKVDSDELPPPPRKCKQRQKNQPDYDLEKHYYEITGVDVTQIPGLGPCTVQSILSETGWDMGRWKNEKCFASWLGLSPNNKISGGKILSRNTRKVQNRAAQAFRLAASTLRNSKSYLGAFFRRIASRKDKPTAITAAARKLAIIFYQMLKLGRPYEELGEDYYTEKYKERAERNLKRKAEKMGFVLVPQNV